MTRDGFFGGGRGATSSEWSSRAGSGGFVDLEQGMGCDGDDLDGRVGLAVGWVFDSWSRLSFIGASR